jgi:TatD DNase family protein
MAASKTDNSDSYILVDIGANLTNKKYSRDVDSVVQRAKEVGIQKIMVTGSNIQISKEALRLTRLFPDTLFSTAGMGDLVHIITIILNYS